MNFQQELKRLKVAIDKELERQFDIAIAEAKKEDLLIAEALTQTKKIALSGGKRIRGALLYWAYCGVGGKEKKKILKVSAAIELVHLFLLAHDDIIDRGNLRHGEKTLNSFFAKKKFATKDALHFGNSMAIIGGDMLYAIANKIIAEAGFDSGATVDALAQLQSVVATTIMGQSQDIAIAYNKKATREQVLSMYKNKTARYTFEGPLHLGAKFAGCNSKKTLEALSSYAVPLGIAFQIQDDILGIFGNDKKTGKSVASDIEEGKQSIMVVKARELATPLQKKKVDSILGKKKLSQDEIKIFQDILKSTGAFEYCKNLAEKYLMKGKKEITKAGFSSGAEKFFMGLVGYLKEREI